MNGAEALRHQRVAVQSTLLVKTLTGQNASRSVRFSLSHS